MTARLGLGVGVLPRGVNFHSDAYLAADFVNERYRLGSRFERVFNKLVFPGLSVSRNLAAYVQDLNPDGSRSLRLVAANQPRIGRGLGLLVEEARTNLLLRSQEFDNAAWTKAGGAISANALTAPDGTTTAETFTEDSATGVHGLTPLSNTSVTSGTAYTQTVYAKAGTRNWLRLGQNSTVDSLTQGFAWFNLSTGAVGTVQSGIVASIDALADGWYRCRITWTAGATSANGSFVLRAATADNELTYAGNGAGTISVWGAQVEAGSFATSYIPTTSASVTRPADVISIDGLSVAIPSTAIASFTTGHTEAVNRRVAHLRDAAVASQFHFTIETNTVKGRIQNQSTGVSTANTFTAGVPATVAGLLAASEMRIAMNGGGVATAAAGFDDDLVTLFLGTGGSSAFLNGYLRRFILYPRAFSDAELIAASAQ
jgi:hypothetical protein